MTEAAATRDPLPEDRHRSLIDAARKQFEEAKRRDSRSAMIERRASDEEVSTFADWLSDSLPGYRIAEEVHRGGQGVVYKARHEATRRDVAIKVLREGPFADLRDRARFEREVHILGQLKHPNIVTIHDSGSAAGNFYFVMDYIRGRPLDEYIAAENLTLNKTLELFAKICDAVNVAHLRGVIHRDLKPSNIRVDQSGEPHVLDFGLAKVDEFDAIADSRTAVQTLTGQFIGSLPWASPEQVEGRQERIDIRTDVYSLGVILYQVLARRFPYEVVGNLRDVLDNICHAEPRKPGAIRGEINDEVDSIVLKCLSKSRQRRYQSAGDLARDIRRYLAGEPIEAKHESGWYVLRKTLRRHRVSLGIGASFLFLLAASSALSWVLYASAERARGIADHQMEEATDRLWESYLAQARAGRLGDHPGRRFDSLEALKKAAAIRPSLPLRNEAIASMTQCDLRLDKTFPPSEAASAVGLRTIDHFARGTPEGEIDIISTADGHELLRLVGPRLFVRTMVFSPDGRYLAAKYHSGRKVAFRVWDLTQQKALVELAIGKFRAGIAFSPDSRWVALGQSDHRIHLYHLPSGTEWRTIPSEPAPYCLSAHPSGQKLAISSLDEPYVQVRDLTGEVVVTMAAPTVAYALAWDKDGRILAGGCTDFRIYLWDGESGGQRSTLVGHQAPVIGVFFSHREHFLVSSGWDETTRLWDIRTGRQILGPLHGCTASGFGERLATWGFPGEFALWHFEPGHEYSPLYSSTQFGNVSRLSIGPAGRLLASAGVNGLRLWDLRTGAELAVLTEQEARWTGFLPDGSGLIATVDDGLRFWPLRVRGDTVEVGESSLLLTQAGPIKACLSSDGRSVALCFGSELSLFDLAERQVRISFPGYPRIGNPSISSDGRWIVTGTWRGGNARIWDTRTGQALREFPGASVNGMFSPDGRWLVIADGPEYHFYEVDTWTLQRSLKRLHRYKIAGAVAFTSDGSVVALSHSPYVVQLVDTSTFEPLAMLAAPDPKLMTDLCFSPDAGLLAVATIDRVIQVWNLRRVREQLRYLRLDWHE